MIRWRVLAFTSIGVETKDRSDLPPEMCYLSLFVGWGMLGELRFVSTDEASRWCREMRFWSGYIT